MHSRSLREFERDLVNGIVGELRNLVVIYRSQKGPDMEYYPRIEQVIDSFGNSSEGTEEVETGLRLKVGDTVQFECRGWDPQDRTLLWDLFGGLYATTPLGTAEGSAVSLTLTITEQMVREKLTIVIWMKSSGKYHRHTNNDDFCAFRYTVVPPGE